MIFDPKVPSSSSLVGYTDRWKPNLSGQSVWCSEANHHLHTSASLLQDQLYLLCNRNLGRDHKPDLSSPFSLKILAHTVETQKPNMFPSVGPLCPRNIHQSCAESTCHSRLCLCLVSCTSSAGSHTICSLRLEKTWVILFDAGNRDISLGLKLVEPQTPHHKAK